MEDCKILTNTEEVNTENLKIGFIGAGKIAQALCKGFINSKLLRPQNIYASSSGLNKQNIKTMHGFGVNTLVLQEKDNCNQLVAQECNVIIIAVKPHIMFSVLTDILTIGEENLKSKLVISVVSGITLAKIEKYLPNTPVIRVMPNTPCLLQCGVSVCSSGLLVKKDDCALVMKLFSSVGICEFIKEGLLDAVTGLSGSGPAYGFLMIEALSDGGVKQGLPRDLAKKLAAQTLLGSARMVLDTGIHPAILKDNIASPGGTTISGCHELEKGCVRAKLIDAVEAATKRAKELNIDY